MEGGQEREHVERHYGRGNLLDSILGALREMGRSPGRLAPADLAPVDAFHIRGREATVELASRAGLTAGLRVLDVGCGLGGSARYLASEYRVQVTGIDLTREYVDAANALTEVVSLEDRVEFRRASALDLPFEDGAFDVAWTEHAQMNIVDKRAFYGEMARVLRPGGRLLFHDIFQGPGGPLYFPVPWAEDEAINFLIAPDTTRRILEESGFAIQAWEDVSRASLDWFRATLEKLRESGPPPLGFHLLTGDNARLKFENQIRSLQESRMIVVQARARKKSQREGPD